MEPQSTNGPNSTAGQATDTFTHSGSTDQRPAVVALSSPAEFKIERTAPSGGAFTSIHKALGLVPSSTMEELRAHLFGDRQSRTHKN